MTIKVDSVDLGIFPTENNLFVQMDELNNMSEGGIITASASAVQTETSFEGTVVAVGTLTGEYSETLNPGDRVLLKSTNGIVVDHPKFDRLRLISYQQVAAILK